MSYGFFKWDITSSRAVFHCNKVKRDKGNNKEV